MNLNYEMNKAKVYIVIPDLIGNLNKKDFSKDSRFRGNDSYNNIKQFFSFRNSN